MSQKNKKNILIGGLLAIVVVMGIAYAAFATSLNITGTSNVTSNWNVKITNITTLTKSSGADNVEGSPTYDNTNGLTAAFNTTLTSPGDYAIYKIEVTNLGSLNAVLSSITGPTNNNNDITFYVNKDQNNQDITDTDRMIGTNDVLNATGDSNNLDKGYVYVTVVYRDYPNQQTPEVATATATVTLNFTQSSSEASGGSGGGSQSSGYDATTGNGTIYSLHSGYWYQDVEGNATGMSSITSEEGANNISNMIVTKDTPNIVRMTSSATNIQNMTAGTDYVTDPSNLHKDYYLRYTVTNFLITESYVCFVYNNAEHCMKGADGGASYATNTSTIQAYKTYYEIPDGGSDGCDLGSSELNCYGGSFYYVYANSNGNVDVRGSASEYCYVSDDGYSYCNE